MEENLKQLLLKDLCARLQYGVKILHTGWDYDSDTDFDTVETLIGIDDRFIHTVWDKTGDREKHCLYVSNWKHYLRPMSSMTEKEKEDFYQNVLDMDIEDIRYENNGKLPLPYNQKDKFIWFEDIYLDNAFAVIDWLNAHHFDYRGLIERGLAIEVTEVNNPYKK